LNGYFNFYGCIYYNYCFWNLFDRIEIDFGEIYSSFLFYKYKYKNKYLTLQSGNVILNMYQGYKIN